ncbi:MAG: helix-turn-helix domain-containing protein [Candidatus Contendobacter sp.]|nr:helix-turn-helix domain-containing protein [Candidatus Contendobacter sp.]MDG4557189.1 helix-turn-helix domain-containing protein [Candidatus Contendobacter sp.]
MTSTMFCEPPATGSGFFDTALVVAFGSILLLVGTGGSLNPTTAQAYPAQDFTAPTTEITQVPPGETAPEEPAPAVQSLADRVSAIKAAFGLTISQLAKVLRVERQTIYDWMDEEHSPQLQEQKRERLAAIERWAAQWNALCPWPAGKGITTYQVEGATLLDLLLADVLDEARLTHVLRGLSEQVKAEWQRREERSFGEQARRRGFQPHGQSLRSVLAGFGGSVSLTHDDE